MTMPKFTVTPAMIEEVAGELDVGYRVFVHRSTGAIEVLMDLEKFDDVDEEIRGITQRFLDRESADYVEVERWNTREEFEMMAGFAEQLADAPAMQEQLITALNGSKPFRNFKFIINNAGPYRQQWFAFKDARQQAYVKKRLELLLADDHLK